jgi:hypothetical protein
LVIEVTNPTKIVLIENLGSTTFIKVNESPLFVHKSEHLCELQTKNNLSKREVRRMRNRRTSVETQEPHC